MNGSGGVPHCVKGSCGQLTVLEFLNKNMGAKNRVGVGLSYQPARLHILGLSTGCRRAIVPCRKDGRKLAVKKTRKHGSIRSPKGVMGGGSKKARTDQAMVQKEDD